VAIVVARFNDLVTAKLLSGSLATWRINSMPNCMCCMFSMI